MMHVFGINSTFLLAAGQDWIQVVLPVVFFVIYLLGHLATNSMAKSGRRPNQAGRNAPRGQVPAGQGPVREPTPQDPLNREIEEFLRRAAEARRGKSSALQPAPAEPAVASPTPSPTVAERATTPKARAADRLTDRVSASVERHLGRDDVGTHADRLSDDMTRADREMEKHLRETFDHRLGTLGDSSGDATISDDDPSTSARPAPSQATALAAAALASTANVRQAIILNEILSRPEHRWD
jgi:hypothetical protein